MPGKENVGIIVTIVPRIVGAVVGGYISTFFGFGMVDGLKFGSFFVAVIGAIFVLTSTKKLKDKFIKGA